MLRVHLTKHIFNNHHLGFKTSSRALSSCQHISHIIPYHLQQMTTVWVIWLIRCSNGSNAHIQCPCNACLHVLINPGPCPCQSSFFINVLSSMTTIFISTSQKGRSWTLSRNSSIKRSWYARTSRTPYYGYISKEKTCLGKRNHTIIREVWRSRRLQKKKKEIKAILRLCSFDVW